MSKSQNETIRKEDMPVTSGLARFFRRRLSNAVETGGMNIGDQYVMETENDCPPPLSPVAPLVQLKNLSDNFDKVKFLQPSQTKTVQ